jgi:MoaA/NifB/PqqE/SkfB family radical SAM enzyme
MKPRFAVLAWAIGARGDEESYERMRGNRRFKYMVRGVQNLRRHYSGKIAAKCTLMTSNIRNLEGIIRLAEDLGFDVVKFNCVREAGRAMWPISRGVAERGS